MKTSCFSMFPSLFVVFFSVSWVTSAIIHDNFLHCLYSHHSNDFSSISKVTYTPLNSSYSPILEFNVQNLRFSSPSRPKPLVIVTPLLPSHVQATVLCAKEHGLQIRIRSGGHDFEGLSYISKVPFVIVDFINFRSIDIDVKNKVAWVQSGAILGELYYEIAQKSRTLAFPAGICHTVGLGGYFSGGGYGPLFRKYGLAADNIIDAQFIDAKGRILDRKSMGEDLFWAIRGGGGGSFGIVLAWKIKLVHVPPTVTVFTISKTLEENAIELIYKWQRIGPTLPKEMFQLFGLSKVNSSHTGKSIILATFTSTFLGRADELIPLMHKKFPELGLMRKDCTEMSWAESILFLDRIQNKSLNALLDRNLRYTIVSPSFKIKSDYVKRPIPEIAVKELWSRLLKAEGTPFLFFIAYGGKMDEIPETATPFPHRAGNLFKILYHIGWQEEDNRKSQKHIRWIRNVYSYMRPFVSQSPREAYANYRDLDIGSNDERNTSYAQASIWGHKYFKNNFDKLVRVKKMIDPENFFKHEQSIPPGFF